MAYINGNEILFSPQVVKGGGGSCLTGEGSPTPQTGGGIGSLYMDTLTGEIYKCTAEYGGEYTWSPITPLHYNHTPTLTNVAFEELFNWKGIEGNPYTNSFRTSDFSRTPQIGDIFSLIFTDRLGNKVYSFAEITDPPNDAGFTPFKVVQAMLLNIGDSDGALESTNDKTDRLAEMQAILDERKYLKLGTGEFYLSGQLRIGGGAVLEGCGASTKIMQTPDSTQPSMIWLQSEGTIQNVCLQGAWNSKAEVTTTPASYRIGIALAYGTHNAIINSCFIRGWTHSGIAAEENGTATYSFIASNCDFCYNAVGMRLATTEYACVSHCVFHHNKIGVVNNAGNNKFTACGFDNNVAGFYIADGYNNGHGNATGCTFNHNDEAVHIENNVSGFVFSSSQFHYGAIHIYSSVKGTLFTSCQFGRDMQYINYSTYPTMFEGCIFSQSPKTESKAYIDNADGFRFVDCINYNKGESVDNVDNSGGAGGVNIASAEKWTFTLADGTTVEKDVLIGNEDVDVEEWSFTLEDGTVVKKAVMLDA